MSERKLILWVGETAPETLLRIAEVLGLTVAPIDQLDIPNRLEQAHAVLMPFTGATDAQATITFQSNLRRILAPILNSGALLLIVAESPENFEVASKLA